MPMEVQELKEYVEKRFDLEEAARRIATEGLDKRLDLLNELRGDVVTKTEYVSKHDELERRLRAVETFKDNTQGRFSLFAIMMTIAVIVAQIILHYVWGAHP